MITKYHAKYYANLLSCQAVGGNIDSLSQSLLNASVDINPHQIEAALFAFKSPLSKGVIFADEVGLGKTIEAGLVLCQLWAIGKRKIIIICPASIRKQWGFELTEKFGIDNEVLDTKNYNQYLRIGADPFDQKRLSSALTILRRAKRKRLNDAVLILQLLMKHTNYVMSIRRTLKLPKRLKKLSVMHVLSVLTMFMMKI